jgi:hypothetical protein
MFTSLKGGAITVGIAFDGTLIFSELRWVMLGKLRQLYYIYFKVKLTLVGEDLAKSKTP